jgi:hypothetical protein
MNNTVAPTRHELWQVVQANSHSGLVSQQAWEWAEQYRFEYGHLPSAGQIRDKVQELNKPEEAHDEG